MRRILIVGLLCFFASAALARNGAVRTRDGRTIEGDLTEKESEVVITTKAGSIAISLTDVAFISYGNTVKEQYEQRLAALPKTASAASHIELARWLFDSKEYTLARVELDKAIELDANNADAVALKQAVERSMVWERTRQKSPAGVEETGSATPPVALRDRRILDVDQINHIRQGELKETDRPRVRLEGDLRQRYVRHSGKNPTQFAVLPDALKAMEILKNGTPDMRPDVKILSDPVPLMRFKSRIQPIVLNGCATANCHGGTTAGTFVLHNPAPNEATAYTNFYILTQSNPNLNGAIHKSIDRQQPGDSLILQYGLPPEQAQFSHPQVQGWAPLFRNTRDPKYLEIVGWIQSLVPIAPDYGFAFELPGGGPTTQPAETPSPTTNAPVPDTSSKPAEQQPAKEGGAKDALDEIRGRLRPIRGL